MWYQGHHVVCWLSGWCGVRFFYSKLLNRFCSTWSGLHPHSLLEFVHIMYFEMTMIPSNQSMQSTQWVVCRCYTERRVVSHFMTSLVTPNLTFHKSNSLTTGPLVWAGTLVKHIALHTSRTRCNSHYCFDLYHPVCAFIYSCNVDKIISIVLSFTTTNHRMKFVYLLVHITCLMNVYIVHIIHE